MTLVSFIMTIFGCLIMSLAPDFIGTGGQVTTISQFNGASLRPDAIHVER